MIKKQALVFLLRCCASSLGMWLCISWFGHVSTPADAALFVSAGIIFSIINSVVKPLVKVMVLPLAIVTMGVSTILINVGMIWLTLHFLSGVEMSFWGFVASSVLMSLINGLVNLIMPSYNKQ